MMRTLIVSGGNIEEDFALDFLRRQPEYDDIIAADKGAAFCLRAGLVPSLLVGDFDTLPEKTLEHFRRQGIPIRAFQPEKDVTDMEIALSAAARRQKAMGDGQGRGTAVILGGTGSRMDHVLGTIYAAAGIAETLDCEIVDRHNRIRVLLPGEYAIAREEEWGKYISFLPIGGEAAGVTLEGFRYPLREYQLTPNNSLGVSNELTADVGRLFFRTGRLAFIRSRD